MPHSPNPHGLSVRQERFCQSFVQSGVAVQAAVEAGYSPIHCRNQGYRLLRRPEIQARLAEIQAAQARAACRDTDVLLGKLEYVYRRALGDQLYHAAARAVDLQARILRHAQWDRRALAAAEASAEGENEPRRRRDTEGDREKESVFSSSRPAQADHPQVEEGVDARIKSGHDGAGDGPVPAVQRVAERRPVAVRHSRFGIRPPSAPRP